MLLEEEQVVPLLLPRLPEHRQRHQLLLLRHGDVEVRLRLLHGQAAMHNCGLRRGVVVGALGVVVRDLGRAGRHVVLDPPGATCLPAAARAATLCFYSIDMLSHEAPSLRSWRMWCKG